MRDLVLEEYGERGPRSHAVGMMQLRVVLEWGRRGVFFVRHLVAVAGDRDEQMILFRFLVSRRGLYQRQKMDRTNLKDRPVNVSYVRCSDILLL